jgi:hypothetical protein
MVEKKRKKEIDGYYIYVTYYNAAIPCPRKKKERRKKKEEKRKKKKEKRKKKKEKRKKERMKKE